MDYKYIPHTKAELKKAILTEIEVQGKEADLNCIDTSGWNFESVGKLTLPESFSEKQALPQCGRRTVQQGYDQVDTYLHHDSMSTVRYKRLTHVEKPKQSTLFQANKVLCFLVLPDLMLAQGKPLRRSTLFKLS